MNAWIYSTSVSHHVGWRQLNIATVTIEIKERVTIRLRDQGSSLFSAVKNHHISELAFGCVYVYVNLPPPPPPSETPVLQHHTLGSGTAFECVWVHVYMKARVHKNKSMQHHTLGSGTAEFQVTWLPEAHIRYFGLAQKCTSTLWVSKDYRGAWKTGHKARTLK